MTPNGYHGDERDFPSPPRDQSGLSAEDYERGRQHDPPRDYERDRQLDAAFAEIERFRALRNRFGEPALLAATVEALRAALTVAAEDLDKAANQFAGIQASQETGHQIEIHHNPDIFAAKAARARQALSDA